MGGGGGLTLSSEVSRKEDITSGNFHPPWPSSFLADFGPAFVHL